MKTFLFLVSWVVLAVMAAPVVGLWIDRMKKRQTYLVDELGRPDIDLG